MTIEKKFWHELTDTEMLALLKAGGMTWGEAQKKYPQPPWCDYPEAVCGVMGCWSLMGIGGKNPLGHRIRKREDCKGCDLIKEAKPYDSETICSSIG